MKKKSETDIERLYENGSFKISLEKSDFLLPQIIDFVKSNKWINLTPEYQRRLVWDKKKKSAFIESLLMNIPVPPVFLLEWEYGRYEVMDGQQRLSAIIEFYENRFKLTGLHKWSALNGKTYADCPPIIKRGLERRRISATVILAESGLQNNDKNEIRKTVFERLNTGGQNLNAQELRNCLYAGRFNDLLIELAAVPLYNDVLGIPRYKDNIRKDFVSEVLAKNTFYKRMEDVEIVLRFFAFRDKAFVKGSVRSILDNCMNRLQNPSETQVTQLRSLFISRLNTCYKIFGSRVFKLKQDNGKEKFSKTLFDALMVAVDNLQNKEVQLIAKKKKIVENFYKKLENPAIHELIIGEANTAAAIKRRSETVQKILEDNLK